MSLKELDNKQATEETEQESARVSWFRKSFPHFFSSKVEQARRGVHTLPHITGGYPLARHLTHSQTVIIGLHRNPRGEFEFRLGCDVNLPISRNELVKATGHVSGSSRVRIKIGTEVLRLNRAELLTAFQKLEGTYRDTD